MTEYLAEQEAEEMLQLFLGGIDSGGEQMSYDDFSTLATDTKLPLALRSLILHRGVADPNVASKVHFSAKNANWFFSASDYGSVFHKGTNVTSTMISRSRRKYLIGPTERSSVMFYDLDIRGSMAFEGTPRSYNTYLLGRRERSVNDTADSQLGEVALMSSQLELPAQEILANYVRISSSLIGELLSIGS